VLKLYVSTTAIDTQFIVKLTDQHPQDAASRAKGEQPAYTPVSKGWLKASHREKDQARSTPQRPFYTHSNPQPLAPGVIYQFDIEVGRRRDGWCRFPSVAYVFKKGHRIRLELAQRRLACDRRRIFTPLSSLAHASRIILPVLVAKRNWPVRQVLRGRLLRHPFTPVAWPVVTIRVQG
jgi:predicted acyl esterase